MLRAEFRSKDNRIFGISVREEAMGYARQYYEIIIVSTSNSKHLISPCAMMPTRHKTKFLERGKCSTSTGCRY